MVLAIREADCKAVIVALILAFGLGLQTTPATAAATPGFLKIIVLKGNKGINDLNSKTAVLPLVEIRDTEDRPVRGATVTFTAPDKGPTVVFLYGEHSATVEADAVGHARAPEMKPRNAGAFKLQISAFSEGRRGMAVISQTNVQGMIRGVAPSVPPSDTAETPSSTNAEPVQASAPSATLITTRALLVGTGANQAYVPSSFSQVTSEDDGYGLYSYIIFGSPPGPAKIEIYLSLLRAYLDMFHDVDVFAKSIPKQQLNITYLAVSPTTKPPGNGEDLAGWLLNNYDYGRAAIIAANAGLTPTGGPYIVSSLAPLSEAGQAKTRIIFQQDLSWVSANLMPLYLTQFEKRVSGRPTTWSESTMESFALELRTVIQATADEAGSVAPALTAFIQVRETSK